MNGRLLLACLLLLCAGCTRPSDAHYKAVEEYLHENLDDPDYELVTWWPGADAGPAIANWRSEVETIQDDWKQRGKLKAKSDSKEAREREGKRIMNVGGVATIEEVEELQNKAAEAATKKALAWGEQMASEVPIADLERVAAYKSPVPAETPRQESHGRQRTADNDLRGVRRRGRAGSGSTGERIRSRLPRVGRQDKASRAKSHWSQRCGARQQPGWNAF